MLGKGWAQSGLVGVCAASLIAGMVHSADPAHAGDGSPTPSGAEGTVDLGPTLERIREKHSVPAIGAAGIKEGELWGIGVAGVRQWGTDVPVTLDDRWHIGACTMPMTATLAAMLVEEGTIEWSSTVAGVLPEVGEVALDAYRDVTLEQLLRHQAGLPGDRSPESRVWKLIEAAKGPMRERRIVVSKIALRQEPRGRPGGSPRFARLGYVVAGAMLEAAADRDFEELMRERLFEPLGMTSAGFGPPGTPGALDEPLGHAVGFGNVMSGMTPTQAADDPEVLAPAGTVHCSIGDWAKFAMLHLRGARGGEGLLLTPQSFDVMHTDFRRRRTVPMGWAVTGRMWSGGPTLMQDGTNSFWYATIAIGPKGNVAYLAAANRGDEKAQRACQEAISAMAFEELAGAGDGEE